MKKVDFNKLQAGDLVEVPRTQFAPMRRGWNGWKCVGECGGKRWNGRSAPKVDLYPAQMKLRFEVEKGGE